MVIEEKSSVISIPGFLLKKPVMDTHTLITKLELAAKRSLYLAEQEKEKTERLLSHSTDPHHHARAVTRENFFRGQHDTILTIIEEVASFGNGGEEDTEEQEEVIFLARKLIAGVSYPWIRRHALDEWLYNEVRNDKEFEQYAKGLPIKQKLLMSGEISLLGLEDILEKELEAALHHTISGNGHHGRSLTIKDVVDHKDHLKNLFKDGWTQKSNLICFRLYEFGLV